MNNTLPPTWAFQDVKPIWQQLYDLIGAPLRMILLPDSTCENWHLTSLRSERFRKVLPVLKGRVLDIGAGDNVLLHLYREQAKQLSVSEAEAYQSVGVDVVDWGSDCLILDNSAKLPFEDQSFDTVSYIACINHIPERLESLKEVKRLLRPGGQVVVTMIGRWIGKIGHALWWYSEDKHREVDEHEEMGMDPKEVIDLFKAAGFRLKRHDRFVYGLNSLYLFEPDEC